MTNPRLLFIVCLASALVSAQPSISYKASITLPVDLYTADGIKIEKGEYQVRVELPNEGGSLAFLADDKVKAQVKGQAPQGDLAVMPAPIPLMGALYLRSSVDPMPTAQERQFSKTGRTQYEEETRDWKAVLRSYRTRDVTDVYFVFQVREAQGKWKRVDFRLSSKPGKGTE